MLLLYAVTDPAYGDGVNFLTQIEEALKGGATLLQLREKDLPKEAFLKKAFEVQALARRYQIPLLINDRVDIALQCNADGVHVGQSDTSASDARRLLEPGKILGVTAKTVEQAKKAYLAGADYIGSGAVYQSSTKQDAGLISKKELTDICQCVPIPVTAIGGITTENIVGLKGTGVKGAAVISGLFAQTDIRKTAHTLKEQMKEVVTS
nr:thiamine phosphate synthase [Clostridium sp. E02]